MSTILSVFLEDEKLCDNDTIKVEEYSRGLLVFG